MVQAESKINTIINKALERKVFPGCVIGIYDNGNIQMYPFGRYTYDNSSPTVNVDTLYDIASLTKVIPTSLLALHLIDKGDVDLHVSVSSLLPQFDGKYKDKVTLFHLLTQTVTFPFTLSECVSLSIDQLRSLILTSDLVCPPGTHFTYTNASSILMGWIIEKVTGKDLAIAARDMLFNPLQLTHASFTPLPEICVPTELQNGKEICGVVHDESARLMSKNEHFVGSAGVFSNAKDILAILEVIMTGGKVQGKTFLSEDMMRTMESNQLSYLGLSHGLGWELDQEFFMGRIRGRIIGKTGFTGCSMMVNREQQKALVILSNHIYPHRRRSREEINSLRRECSEVVFKEK